MCSPRRPVRTDRISPSNLWWHLKLSAIHRRSETPEGYHLDSGALTPDYLTCKRRVYGATCAYPIMFAFSVIPLYLKLDYAIRLCLMSPPVVNVPSRGGFLALESACVFCFIHEPQSVNKYTSTSNPNYCTYYNKTLFGGYQCLVTISLRFRAPLRFLFTVIAVVVITLDLLPLPALHMAWPLITEKPPDDTGVRLDVSASRCECPSHCFSVIRPRCVVCKLRPVLQTKQLSCQDADCRSTFAYLYVIKEAIPDHSDEAPTSI